MKLAHDLIVDSAAAPADGSKTLATWYAPGPVDELGDRLLMFDNSSAPSLELLRFRRTLTATPGFEVALRRRVERLRQFRHPSFACVRAVEYLGPDDGLALLSNHTPGRRLSEVLQDARGPAFAISLIRQLTPALVTLQQCGDGIGHGAVAASRIVIAPDGRLVIVEHVLGSALERLQLPANRLRSDFGIPVPPSDSFVRPRFDNRTDCFQLGLVAISLLLGRRLGPDEYGRDLDKLMDLAAHASDRESPTLFPRLRVWLERALQLDGASFESTGEALDALNDLSSAGALRGVDPIQEPPKCDRVEVAAPEPPPTAPPAARAAAPEPDPPQLVTPPPARPAEREAVAPQAAATTGNHEVTVMEPRAPATPISSLFNEVHVGGSASHAAFLDESLLGPSEPESRGRPAPVDPPRTVPPAAHTSRRRTVVRTLIIALAVCAAGEGLVILTLLQRRGTPEPTAITVDTLDPGADVLVDGRVAGVTPLQVTLAGNTRSIRVVSPRAEATKGVTPAMPARHEPAVNRAAPTGAVAAAPPQRSGGIRVSSPIEVEVFEGDRRLGSSATGIVSATAGRHTLDLVNSALGYRSRQAVTVSAGRVVPLNLTLPNGRLSINALPWAEVLIDGKSVGETPLGNLSVPLGEHEIVFRHPQLGERRQTAVVRVDGVTRVSANLQR